MRHLSPHAVLALSLSLSLALLAPVSARAEPSLATGTRTVTLHSRDGTAVVLGTVAFQPDASGRTAFALTVDPARVTDHFLSMREFKCIDGKTELWCHVPYPHRSPATIAVNDLAWLEHALMFFYKLPTDFGAKLWNGIYFDLAASGNGFVGVPQAIDLNHIAAPPDVDGAAPYRKALREAIPPGARWISRITID